VSLVLDASLALAWFLEDEATPHSMAVLDLVAEEGAEVPALWPHEIANGFASGARRTPSRISRAQVARAFDALAALPIRCHTVGEASGAHELFELALQFGISAYDASYLALARDRSLPLGTLDGAGRRNGLKQAAAAAGVRVLTLASS
jgi:predicted nucleic acid-binding protein